jgi:hypothetical protein
MARRATSGAYSAACGHGWRMLAHPGRVGLVDLGPGWQLPQHASNFGMTADPIGLARQVGTGGGSR